MCVDGVLELYSFNIFEIFMYIKPWQLHDSEAMVVGPEIVLHRGEAFKNYLNSTVYWQKKYNKMIHCKKILDKDAIA